ncbi:MAG: phosphoenolpyruvate carboxykinase (GTP) [Candidatus Altiarchaeales archaeon]|nr:phosphoenolpyruvate carboxykinase (GTP) [Candidatus Altiarchaeales archaeon]
MDSIEVLKEKLGSSYAKLEALNNEYVNRFILEYAGHCQPDSIWVCDNSEEDIQYIRDQAVEKGEERRLKMVGHTVHFDGYRDQGRDKANTRYLLPKGVDLGELNSIDKEEGLAEVKGYLKGSMRGKEMLVLFFTLGPEDSDFSLPCMQITDSYYVAHSETILYRGGYRLFRDTSPNKFFRFIHSAGKLEGSVSKNIDKRRVYIDLEDEIVYSTNTQYGGNTIGLKKLSMRLAIQKACNEDWLTEHMFVMGVHNDKGEVTYFTGAYPSACGKTSTSMVEGETIVGDDIAYLKVIDGRVRAVNVEKGIFGIISDVNSRDDPIIYKALTSKREVIFSNVLIDKDDVPYWIGKDGECPEEGVNHSGEWTKGKKDAAGNEITPSHKNARYTIAIDELDNRDPHASDPKGVEVGGIIYGGRDSDTSVPVEEAFNWEHGIITKGATLESETTAATLGQEGVRKFNPMSNLDFVSVPLGKYIQCNLDFGNKAKKQPRIFSVNYFLKDDEGNFLNGKEDKRVWLKWMEHRVRNKVDAIVTPTGQIPKYDDLQRMFALTLGKEYSKEDYEEQFTFRCLEHMAKIDRIEVIYREKVPDTPEIVFKVLDQQRKRIETAREEFGDYILPDQLN